jgi:hypothetical protein
MSQDAFFDNICAYGKWKNDLIGAIKSYQDWLDNTKFDDSDQSLKIYETLQTLNHDRITLAFVGEFSRGKTELINAIFFSQFKRRLLPSEAGRTTMCPTEIFYDHADPKPYIRLLPIESRIDDISISEQKRDTHAWTHIQLDINSADNMISAFAQITNIKTVKVSKAKRLGLYDLVTTQYGNEINDDETVEIPMWRHALINFPHPFLEQGMSILDTPGLNSLGNEPELTINMLPNAQAAIFVLSADTGVTRSDMDIWRRHLKSFRRNNQRGLIVALNKIDTLWDDLKNEHEIKNSITRQCKDTAKTLSLDIKRIFAVSALKGLIARIRNDQQLLNQSNLMAMESVLSNEILPHKEILVRDTIISDINEMMQNSKHIILSKYNLQKDSINQLNSLSGDNEEVIQQLLEKTRHEQTIYHRNVESLQSGRQILLTQNQRLKASIDLDKLDRQINDIRQIMQGSWTTTGMKSGMKKLFDDIHSTMTNASKQAELTNRLVKSIYNRYHQENGYNNIKPKLFLIFEYQQEIKKLYQEAEEYRNSVYATMTEQSFVIKKFFISLVSRARKIYFQLNKDADNWGKQALSPLIRQVKMHKQDLKTRLDQLKQAANSRETITEQVLNLEKQASDLHTQFNEINAILSIVNSPMPSLMDNIDVADNITAIRA